MPDLLRVLPLLQKHGFIVVAAQLPLTSIDDDIAVTRNLPARQKWSVVLVGQHSRINGKTWSLATMRIFRRNTPMTTRYSDRRRMLSDRHRSPQNT